MHALWVASDGEDGERADFSENDLKGLDLSTLDLRAAVFRKAQLDGTNLSSSELALATFEDAHLRGADLSFSLLHGRNFARADLGRANFAGVTAVPLIIRTPSGEDTGRRMPARFISADLQGCDFRGADVSGANFTGAVLNGANFSGAKSVDAVFDEETVVHALGLKRKTG
ncbi:MAG: pentapeptide repeat-containing protein [Alphaproteobacteria bacterium]|nr:pentapeptide repeat-containing protein [Alphaproteobacteria bacterium]